MNEGIQNFLMLDEPLQWRKDCPGDRVSPGRLEAHLSLLLRGNVNVTKSSPLSLFL